MKKELKMVASAALDRLCWFRWACRYMRKALKLRQKHHGKVDVKDHWNFDSNISDQGNPQYRRLHDITMKKREFFKLGRKGKGGVLFYNMKTRKSFRKNSSFIKIRWEV